MPAPSGNFVLDKGFRLLAGQTVTKFRAVKMSTTPGVVTNVGAVGDPAIGIAQFSVSAAELLRGKGVPVRLQGISELEIAAGPVAPGDLVAMAIDGRAKGAAPAAGDRILGIALTPGTNAGDRISVDLTPGRIFTVGS